VSLVTLREDQGGRGMYLTTIEVSAEGDVLVSRRRDTTSAKPQVTRYPAASLQAPAPEFVQQLQAKFLAKGMELVASQNIVPTQIISMTVVPSSPRWELVDQFLALVGDAPAFPLTPGSVLAERKLPGTEFTVTPMHTGGFTLAYQAILNLADPSHRERAMRHAVIGVLLDSGSSLAIDDELEFVQTWLSKQSTTMDDAICDFLANAGLIRRPIRIEQVQSAYSAAF